MARADVQGRGDGLLPLAPPCRRVTITLPYATLQKLTRRSIQEGRSLSNLSALLLRIALDHPSA